MTVILVRLVAAVILAGIVGRIGLVFWLGSPQTRYRAWRERRALLAHDLNVRDMQRAHDRNNREWNDCR